MLCRSYYYYSFLLDFILENKLEPQKTSHYTPTIGLTIDFRRWINKDVVLAAPTGTLKVRNSFTIHQQTAWKSTCTIIYENTKVQIRERHFVGLAHLSERPHFEQETPARVIAMPRLLTGRDYQLNGGSRAGSFVCRTIQRRGRALEYVNAWRRRSRHKHKHNTSYPVGQRRAAIAIPMRHFGVCV